MTQTVKLTKQQQKAKAEESKIQQTELVKALIKTDLNDFEEYVKKNSTVSTTNLVVLHYNTLKPLFKKFDELKTDNKMIASYLSSKFGLKIDETSITSLKRGLTKYKPKKAKKIEEPQAETKENAFDAAMKTAKDLINKSNNKEQITQQLMDLYKKQYNVLNTNEKQNPHLSQALSLVR